MNQSDTELIGIRATATETVRRLTEALEDRGDMQAAIRTLMADGVDMVSLFTEMAGRSPEVMRLVLQSSVAVLVNMQAANSADRELKRRASEN